MRCTCRLVVPRHLMRAPPPGARPKSSRVNHADRLRISPLATRYGIVMHIACVRATFGPLAQMVHAVATMSPDQVSAETLVRSGERPAIAARPPKAPSRRQLTRAGGSRHARETSRGRPAHAPAGAAAPPPPWAVDRPAPVRFMLISARASRSLPLSQTTTKISSSSQAGPARSRAVKASIVAGSSGQRRQLRSRVSASSPDCSKSLTGHPCNFVQTTDARCWLQYGLEPFHSCQLAIPGAS